MNHVWVVEWGGKQDFPWRIYPRLFSTRKGARDFVRLMAVPWLRIVKYVSER